MPITFVERVGDKTTDVLEAFGDFFTFVGRTFMSLFGGLRPRSWRLLLPFRDPCRGNHRDTSGLEPKFSACDNECSARLAPGPKEK